MCDECVVGCLCALSLYSFCNVNNTENSAGCLAGAWGSGSTDNCPNPCSASGKVLRTADDGTQSCVCSESSYPTISGACAACIKGMDCKASFAAGIQRLQDVPLLPGYWRASSTALTIYKCAIEEACLGTAASAAINSNFSFGCRPESEGPLCEVRYLGACAVD